MRWVSNVAHMEGKNAYRVLVWKLNEKDHLECLGVDGRLSLDLKETTFEGMGWVKICLRIGTRDGLL